MFFSAVELVLQFLGLLGEVAVHLVLAGRADDHLVALVHGPPVVVGQPIAGAEMVEIDQTIADGLARHVHRVDGHVEVVGPSGFRRGRDDLLRHRDQISVLGWTGQLVTHDPLFCGDNGKTKINGERVLGGVDQLLDVINQAGFISPLEMVVIRLDHHIEITTDTRDGLNGIKNVVIDAVVRVHAAVTEPDAENPAVGVVGHLTDIGRRDVNPV